MLAVHNITSTQLLHSDLEESAESIKSDIESVQTESESSTNHDALDHYMKLFNSKSLLAVNEVYGFIRTIVMNEKGNVNQCRMLQVTKCGLHAGKILVSPYYWT